MVTVGRVAIVAIVLVDSFRFSGIYESEVDLWDLM